MAIKKYYDSDCIVPVWHRLLIFLSSLLPL